MLQTTLMPRVFKHTVDGVETLLSDPNPEFSIEQVQDFYSLMYPALLSSTVQGPYISDDQIQYAFSSVIGVKG
ncbi:PRTRC system protein C [Olivibacter domesticus]|uniref:PRTRC system protein C n=1 Tax=Olivibacter domesticus TaxID=407022 RepID=A0A1H7ID43_OLID1|nr:PRTRC system protein C [Olivibacter domesticus]SEK60378.1 PRTRC system protein C [Olivibacter domesticus]